MTHIKKYLLWYILGAIAVIYAIIALVKGEANPMNWFSSNATRKAGNCRCETPDGGIISYDCINRPSACVQA